MLVTMCQINQRKMAYRFSGPWFTGLKLAALPLTMGICNWISDGGPGACRQNPVRKRQKKENDDILECVCLHAGTAHGE